MSRNIFQTSMVSLAGPSILGINIRIWISTIPIQFYGRSEAIGFTQYVTGLVLEHFPNYISVSVSVTSVDGPEALIVRKANEAEPFVHIY